MDVDLDGNSRYNSEGLPVFDKKEGYPSANAWNQGGLNSSIRAKEEAKKEANTWT
jgi:hypothetical protein